MNIGAQPALAQITDFLRNFKIAVVFGGPSAEHDVSLSTSREIVAAIKQAGLEVNALPITADLPAELRAAQTDLVFPATHGAPGEDGTLQGLLDLLGICFVGSGVQASALAMHKQHAKLAYALSDLPLARDAMVDHDNDPDAEAHRLIEALGPEIVLKPVASGSALGVLFCSGLEELKVQLKSSHRSAGDSSDQFLAEERVEGREITVGVWDVIAPADLPDANNALASQCAAMAVTEIVTGENQWYDYHNRYTAGASSHVIPATLAPELSRSLQQWAVRAHQALGCTDLSRSDFIVGSERVVLLETNTLPGMTPTSLYPDAAKAAGMEFSEMVLRLLASAAARGPRYPTLKMPT